MACNNWRKSLRQYFKWWKQLRKLKTKQVQTLSIKGTTVQSPQRKSSGLPFYASHRDSCDRSPLLRAPINKSSAATASIITSWSLKSASAADRHSRMREMILPERERERGKNQSLCSRLAPEEQLTDWRASELIKNVVACRLDRHPRCVSEFPTPWRCGGEYYPAIIPI